MLIRQRKRAAFAGLALGVTLMGAVSAPWRPAAARAETPAPSAEKSPREKSWTELSGQDNAQALRTLLVLARAKEGVPVVTERLQQYLAGPTPQRIAQLIDDLDSSKFPVREKANRELEEILETAAPYLQKALNDRQSLEMTRRLEQLLSRRKAEEALTGRRWQALRILALLEHLGTPEARRALEQVAKESSEAWLASEARDALKRLNKEGPAAAPPWEAVIDRDVGASARAFLTLATAPADGSARPEQVRAVLELADQLPPLVLRSRGVTARQLPHELLPYRKDVLDAYRAEGKENPLRTAVQDAVQTLRESEGKVLVVEEELAIMPEPELLQYKQQLAQLQKERVGEAFFQLAKMAEDLEERHRQRKQETKLWQANYDYVLARLYARQACILEYSAMLGQIRRDSLPPLDKERHKGWHLVPREKVTDRDAQELVLKAKVLLKRLAAEHAGTPWELIARQEANASFGLMWVPLAK